MKEEEIAPAKCKGQKPERLRAEVRMVYESRVDSDIAEDPAGLLRTCSKHEGQV